MSLLNLAWRVLAAVTLTVTGSTAMGQVYHPFAEPLQFDPDWQFFAPVDVDSMMEMSARKRAPTGFFATYDRTYLWASRPDVEQSANTGDFGWGNRFDVGFMTDKRSGWLASFRSIGGPNVYDIVYTERIDRFNADDINDPVNNPVQPFVDANDPQVGTRAYFLGDSLNVFGMSSFELNKTWRREPYRYGGIIEPMVGFRYSTINDHAMNQTYSRSQNTITGLPPTAETQLETLVSDETNTANRMVGGQLGARYFTHYSRWTLSGELRAFGMANFQAREYAQKTFETFYGGAPGLGVDVQSTAYRQSTISETNTEFVFGFEARAEAAYQLTKYINIRGGIDVLDFANGIWRGANPGFGDVGNTDQDVQLAGFTFGISVNR